MCTKKYATIKPFPEGSPFCKSLNKYNFAAISQKANFLLRELKSGPQLVLPLVLLPGWALSQFDPEKGQLPCEYFGEQEMSLRYDKIFLFTSCLLSSVFYLMPRTC